MSEIKPSGKDHFGTIHLNMIKSVIAFALNAANIAITNTITAFANIINRLDTNVETIDGFRASIATPITGYAAQKKAVKQALAAVSANIMKAVYTYAIDQGDEVLAGQMKISQSQLLAMKYVDLVAYVYGASNIVGAIIGSLGTYNVTMADVTAWTTLADQLNALISNPKNAIAFRKQVNQSIQSLLRESMLMLHNQADELAFKFRPDNLDYYNGYLANRRLYPHSLSTQLRLHVTDQSGNPVTLGEVFILSTDSTGTLNPSGYCLVDHIPFGIHTVTLTTVAGTKTLGTFDFKLGHSLTLNITINVTDINAPSTVKSQEIPLPAPALN